MCILPSGKTSNVDRIVTYDGDLNSAIAGQSITLTLKDEVDCSRGQVITAATAPLEVADQFETTLIWMDEEALIPGRSYYLQKLERKRYLQRWLNPNIRSTSIRWNMQRPKRLS